MPFASIASHFLQALRAKNAEVLAHSQMVELFSQPDHQSTCLIAKKISQARLREMLCE